MISYFKNLSRHLLFFLFFICAGIVVSPFVVGIFVGDSTLIFLSVLIGLLLVPVWFFSIQVIVSYRDEDYIVTFIMMIALLITFSLFLLSIHHYLRVLL